MMYRSIFASLFFLSACATQQKQADRAYRFFRVHPQALAALCASQYPVRQEYKTGSETIQIDTAIAEGQSLPCLPQNDPKNSFYKCPPNTKITQRVTRIDTVFAENTARVAEIGIQLESMRAKAMLAETLAKKLGWGLSFAVLGLLAFAFMRFRFLR